MDFDSPDVEKDFPGLYASETGGRSKKDDKDFVEPETEKISKKDLLIGRRKDRKEKKTAYAALEGESSPEEELETKSPSKSKKTKAFKFPSKNKEKREKSREKEKLDTSKAEEVKPVEKPEKEKDKEKKKDKDKKDKDKKEKTKERKDKKLKQSSVSEEVLELGDVQPIFGVSLGLAVERSRCHDSVNLPLVVRDCIDYLQENGMQSDQIYKVDAVKAKLQTLKRAYNNREGSCVNEFDIPTACGLLKLFLRELPEPILTTDLSTRFEEAASHSQVSQQEQELVNLVEQLPSCNRTLLSWVILHLDAVTQNESYTKMNAQNIAMFLSPTLQMSHRLFVAILCHCNNLFADTELLKYVPPITASSPNLPETPDEITVELKKQESLLAQIHAEMNAGFITKKREEQLWEIQRIITQLKRKLRTFEKKSDCTQKSLDDTIDGDNSMELNKAKLSCSDDESSIKTVTGISTESATNTETKNTPQETEESALLERKVDEIDSPDNAKLDKLTSAVGSGEPPAISDTVTVTDNGFMLLPENHPNYLTLIRLQLENQELLNWKSQLQARINAERTEIVRMKRLLNPDSSAIHGPSSLDCSISDNDDYERLVAHYAKENALLEQKRQILAKEIFEENKALIQMQVELALNRYRV
ncbi:ralA-binding protein 1 [Toxorhynchites rutilus septentrionalis]|uniref:ralA-binding protein 1 n=1 Tax=Toxorhynchites rutilus septentrionalis TaxID=329112 RepID=UPI00247A7C55|nr:ralA-binding protein 1 [Toxorhynchites rutilus septentrionalis]